jgi:hypothetical protein
VTKERWVSLAYRLLRLVYDPIGPKIDGAPTISATLRRAGEQLELIGKQNRTSSAEDTLLM